MGTYKVIVCGGRDFTDEKYLWMIMDDLHSYYSITHVISGKARGADTFGENWAKARGLTIIEFPAEWDIHGKMAGPLRNLQMLKEGEPDLVVGFPSGKSKGTYHMMKVGRRAGVPVINAMEWKDGNI